MRFLIALLVMLMSVGVALGSDNTTYDMIAQNEAENPCAPEPAGNGKGDDGAQIDLCNISIVDCYMTADAHDNADDGASGTADDTEGGQADADED